jgi:hypothetical protein
MDTQKIDVVLPENFGIITKSVAWDTLKKMIPCFLRSISEDTPVREFPLSTLVHQFNYQQTSEDRKRFLFLLFLECALLGSESCMHCFLKDPIFEREWSGYMDATIFFPVRCTITGRIGYIVYQDILCFLYERIQPTRIADTMVLKRIMRSMDALPPSFLESYGYIHLVKILIGDWEKERDAFFPMKEPVQ